MAVTRIKNNQITDQTIEYTKIKPYTLVGTLFNPNVTIASNIIIQGNLSVSGTTSTVNSVDTLINDPLVIFNNGYVGTPSYDVGMLINRNLNPVNAAWIWREANVGFAGVLTSETGTTTGSVNNTTYANLIIGNTIIEGQSVTSVSKTTGALQVKGGAAVSKDLFVGKSLTVDNGTYGNVVTTEFGSMFAAGYGPNTSSVLQAAAQNFAQGMGMWAITGGFGTLYSSSGINFLTGTTVRDKDIPTSGVVGVSIAANGAIIAGRTTIDSTSTQTGALIIAGTSGVGIGGNLNVGTTASFETGRVVIAAPSAKANSIVIGGEVGGTLYTGIGAGVTVHGGGIGGTSIGDRSTIIGATAGNAAPGTDSTLVGYQAGGQASGTNNSFFGAFAGNAVTTGNYNVIIGANTGAQIATQDNQIIVSDGQGQNRISVNSSGNVYVWAGLDSTNSNTGAMVVQGGVGIGGNLNVGGAASFASGRVTLDATPTSLILAANTATTYVGGTGITVVGQEIGSASPANFGTGTTLLGYQAFNTATTGAQQTLLGYRTGYSGPGQFTTAVGAQAGLNLLSTASQNQLFGYNAGSQITTGDYNVVLGANTMTGLETVDNYVMISDGQGNGRIQINGSGVTTIYATTESESPSSGALVVLGGIGVAGNSTVGGNLTVRGNLTVLGNTITIGSENLSVQDSIIDLHTFANLDPLGANDGRDIGIRTHYYISNDRHAFFGFQNTTQNLVYLDAATETGGVISGTYGNVQFGSLWLSNSTASASQTSGALVVKGGIGTGALSYLHSATVDNNLTASGTDALVTFSPTGAGTVTINPATAGTIDNMAIGGSTPKAGSFTTLNATQNNFNVTLSPTGTGTVAISPAGALTINPVTVSNMDNVYIGNTTPRQATFTSANIQSDFKLTSFTGNSVLFIDSAATSNLAITQRNENFNFQVTANTFSGYSLNVGVNGDTQTGTDTLNIRYQGDAYNPQSTIAANTVGQAPGWTVSTSRGTGTAPAVTQDGDFNGVFGAYAYTGGTAGYKEIGAVRYVSQGTTGATDGIGGQAQIWTKRDDGASTLAIRVDANQISTFYGQVAIANTTTSTNSTTGALYVAGGTSIAGNLNVAQSARFNDVQNANRDFIVRGGNDATLIWANTAPGYNTVLIGNSAVSANVVQGAKLQIYSTDSFLMPVGDSGQRPDVAVAGMMRFNTFAGDIEFYDGAEWYQPKSGSGFTLITDDQFNGDGSTVEYTMTRGGTTNGTFVTLNGVMQHPSVAYNTFTANNKIIFTEAPAVGDAIDVRSVTLTTEIAGLSSPNGFVTLATENAGTVFKTGETQANVAIHIHENSGALEFTPGNVSVGTSPAVIDVFGKAAFRSGKYVINVQNGNNFEVSEVMVLHDGTTAFRTQYNKIYNTASLGSVTASVTGANVYVYYTGVSSGNFVKTTAAHYG